jgi:hypothetical protein
MKLMIQEIGLELIPRPQEAKEKIGFRWEEEGKVSIWQVNVNKFFHGKKR